PSLGYCAGVATFALVRYIDLPGIDVAKGLENYFRLINTDGSLGPHLLEAIAQCCLLAVDPKPERGSGNKVVDDLQGQYRGLRVGNLIFAWVARRVCSRQTIRYRHLVDTDAPPQVAWNWLVTRAPKLVLALANIGDEDYNASFNPGSLRLHVPGLNFKKAYGSSVLPVLPQDSSQMPSVERDTSYWHVEVRRGKQRKHLKALNRLFPAPTPTDNLHLTQHVADMALSYLSGRGYTAKHHIGMPDTQSKEALAGARLARLNYLFSQIPVGTNQVLVLGLMTLYLGHPLACGMLETEVFSTSMLLAPAPTQLDRFKHLSLCLRKCERGLLGAVYDSAQVSSLAYGELLFGRANFVSNWEDEYANRCLHTLHIQMPSLELGWDDSLESMCYQWRPEETSTSPNSMKRNDEFYSRLRVKLLEYADVLVTKRATQESFRDFWERRHEWIASGSSGGYSLDVTKVDGSKSHPRVKGMKRAWAEGTTYEQVRAHLEDKVPVELARASEKYENGKARAIYGVNPFHYTINTYATKGFEERLHILDGLEKGASGAKAVQLENYRAIITANPDVECSMLDYADFNRHHSPEAQALIFDAFATVGAKKGAHPDWVRANNWVAKAKYRMFVQFPHIGQPTKVVQGMFSGTRSTDLINTLLNLAYFSVARDWIAEQCQLHAQDLYHVHQGDDVWISNLDKVWARTLYYSLNSQGFLFQPAKQMFGSSRGEYLRVLYSNGQGRGYSCRALANYLLRPLQQKTDLDPISWISTVSDGTRLLMRRGVDVAWAQAIYWNDARYWARSRAHVKDKAPVQIPVELLWLPSFQGGAGVLPPGMSWRVDPDVSAPEMPKYTSSARSAAYNLPTHMSDDWITSVSKRDSRLFETREFSSEGIRRAMVDINYADVLNEVERDRGWAVLKASWAKYLQREQTIVTTLRDKKLFQGDAAPICQPSDLKSGLHMSGLCGDASYNGFESVNDIGLHMLLDSLRKHPKTHVPGRNAQSDLLQRVITASKFRSDRVMARALNISRSASLLIIMRDADEQMGDLSNLRFTISRLVRAGQPNVADLLLSGAAGMSNGLDAYCNVSAWNCIIQRYIERMIYTAAIHCQLGQQTTPLRSTRFWTTQCLESARHMDSLSMVVY
ncbi:RNA-directed RNA polymerase, partial [Scaphoideus titanus toti-like virus 1]